MHGAAAGGGLTWTLSSLYIDQFPDGDLARARPGSTSCSSIPTIEEALTLGGSKLAVDGVVDHRRARRLPEEREGPDALPALRVFQAGGQGLRSERPQRAGVQRQAPLDELGRLPGDGGRLAAAGLPVPGRFVAAGDLADAAGRHAVRRAAGRERVRGLRRRRQLRLPRAGDRAVHVRAAPRRRSRRYAASRRCVGTKMWEHVGRTGRRRSACSSPR